MKVVRLLSTKRMGFNRQEIARHTGIPYGGGLTTILNSLEVSDFIVRYIPYGESSRQAVYKLVDSFSLFHLYFSRHRNAKSEKFWEENITSPELNAWRGFSFEELCYVHVPQLKKALGISGIHTEVSPWYFKDKTTSQRGAQIDMLIERSDRVINLCEMKFCIGEFSIDREYDRVLREKIQCFMDETKCKKSVHLTIVTTYGLMQNEYASRVQKVITLDDLF